MSTAPSHTHWRHGYEDPVPGSQDTFRAIFDPYNKWHETNEGNNEEAQAKLMKMQKINENENAPINSGFFTSLRFSG